MDSISKYETLAGAAEALRLGEVSSYEIWETARQRYEARKDELNAYVDWADKLATRTARAADATFAAGLDLGPLHGLPVSFKDHYGINGLPTYAGSSKRLPTKWEHEGPLVKEAKRQLAIIVGKTHSVKFAASVIGDNPHWGAPRNPWDAETPRGTGGSSSGAVVSLWEGACMVAFGTDTRGSVRIPSTMTGAVGLKTTAGRWSAEGIVPLDPKDDTPGPLALSVQNVAYAFAALDPSHAADPKTLLDGLERAELSDFKIGLADPCFWDGCGPGIESAVRDALADLEAAGARLSDVKSSESRELEKAFTAGQILMPELFSFLEAELPEWIEQLEPRLAKRAKHMEDLTAIDYLTSKSWIASLTATADQCFSDVDVIASPTVPRTPPKLIDGIPNYKDDDPPEHSWARNTSVANFFGWCAITLPVGLDAESMPVGLQFNARAGNEEKLLAVAWAAERKLGDVRSRLGTPPLLA